MKGRLMFEIWKAQNGQFFWTLKGGNGEKLCMSETFISKQGAQSGIDAVKRVAPTAPTYDRT
jgi:uncharacterized protein YegP (UPF0339 family)